MVARLVLALTLAGAAALGGLAVTRWRTASTPRGVPDRVDGSLLPQRARERWAVLGFTSPLCTACQRTPHVVAEALATTPQALAESPVDEVAFLSVDVREHGPLVDALDVRATPTVVVLDPVGRVRFFEQGNPAPGALARALPITAQEVPA